MLHDAQRTSAPSDDERLDQHGGLDRHVQRAGNACALERLHVGVLATQRHQAGHLVLGQPDLLAPELGERKIGDLEVETVDPVGDERRVRHVQMPLPVR